MDMEECISRWLNEGRRVAWGTDKVLGLNVQLQL